MRVKGPKSGIATLKESWSKKGAIPWIEPIKNTVEKVQPIVTENWNWISYFMKRFI